MTLDQRLRDARVDLTGESPVPPPIAKVAAHRRHRVAMTLCTLSVLLVGIGGISAVGLSTGSDGESEVAAGPGDWQGGNLEDALLRASDFGEDGSWTIMPFGTSGAPAEGCELRLIRLADADPVEQVGRTIIGSPNMRAVTQQISRFASLAEAERGMDSLRDAFQACRNFEYEPAPGHTTTVSLEPLELAAAGVDEVIGLSGSVTLPDDALGEIGFVVIRDGPVVMVIQNLRAADGAAEPDLQRVVDLAISRLHGGEPSIRSEPPDARFQFESGTGTFHGAEWEVIVTIDGDQCGAETRFADGGGHGGGLCLTGSDPAVDGFGNGLSLGSDGVVGHAQFVLSPAVRRVELVFESGSRVSDVPSGVQVLTAMWVAREEPVELVAYGDDDSVLQRCSYGDVEMESRRSTSVPRPSIRGFEC